MAVGVRQALRIALVAMLGVIASGCAASITRHGYHVPDGQPPVVCDMPIRNDPLPAPNGFEVIGQIEVGDSSFSTDCDEAVVLRHMTIDACQLDADLINITDEQRPDFWSTCYRAKANILRLVERPESVPLVSDDKYRADAVLARSEDTHRRNRAMITGGIVGGALGAGIAPAIVP